ncbi:hypothetical protein P3L10_024219 [Capsicum annuum]
MLGGTPFGVSNPPTPVHPPSLTRQPVDRDDFGRIYIVSVAKGFKPNAGVGKTTRICISRHFNDYWTSWQKVPEHDNDRIFEEFKKFYCWDDANKFLIKKNVFKRCRGRFNDLLNYARKKSVKPKWIPEPLWTLYQRHRNSPEYQLLREKGKRAWASSKNGSLHIAGARSTLAVKEKLEKEKGRELPTDETFEATHLKKKKNPTDEDVRVEPRAKVVHDEFRRLLSEYHSSLPPESQGDPIPQHVRNELWIKASGPANRGHFYGCHTEYFGDNIRCSSGPAYCSSSVDAEIIVRLQNTVSQLTEELTEQRQRYVEQNARQMKTVVATTSQIRMLQQQFSSFIQSGELFLHVLVMQFGLQKV